MSNSDPLRNTLRHRADQLGDSHPLSLDDVKGRARGIRRRRTAVSGLAAAAVLAVAVPVGLAVTDGAGTSPSNPPVAGGSPTPSQDATTTDSSPTPEVPQKVALTTEVEDTSYAPDIPYLFRGAIVRPDGTEVAVDGEYQALAPVGDGWVALRNDEGDFFADVLDAGGTVTGSSPSTYTLAVSPDGTAVSWATPDRELMTVNPGSEPTMLVEPEALPEGIISPVAVIGSESCDQDAEGGGCAVYFNNSDGAQQAAWSATAKGIVGQVPGLLSLGGVSPDGFMSGVVSVDEMNSACSAVLAPDGEAAWDTCDYTLGQFSPDGRYVIGHPAQQSGIGDSSVAILDAETGDLLAEFQNSARHQAFINDVVWDTDSTLLATVFEEGSWSLMRMTPSGELTSVLDGIGDNMDEVPLRLATQP